MEKSFKKAKAPLPKDFISPESKEIDKIFQFVLDYSLISKTKQFTDRGLMLPLTYTQVLSFIKTRYHSMEIEIQDHLIDIMISVDSEITNYTNSRSLKNASKTQTKSKHNRNR